MNMMCLLKIELRRALFSGKFLLCLLALIVLIVFHVATCVIPDSLEQSLYIETVGYPLSVYNRWIGGWGGSVFPSLYYMLLPLIVAVPFSDSLYLDIKSGYAVQIISRSSRMRYLVAKTVACFLGGATLAIVPLAFDFYLTALFLPLVSPDAASGMYPIFAYSAFADIFYENVAVYLAIYGVLTIVCMGLIACFPLLCGFALPNRGLVICSSFIVCLILYFLFGNGNLAWLCPTIFLRADQPVWGFEFCYVCLFLGTLALAEGFGLIKLMSLYEGIDS